MKILVITDQFPPVYFGGMAQHAWHISHYLSQKHDVLVLLPTIHLDQHKDTPFDIIAKLTMKHPRIDAIRALSVAHKFDPDVIHVCTAGLAFPQLSRHYPIVTRVVGNDFLRPWCGGALFLRSLLYRLPSQQLKRYFHRRETALRKRKVNIQLRKCAKVVANSEWTRLKLIEEGIPAEIIETVVGGMDATLFAPSKNPIKLRKKMGLNTDSLIIVTAANLVRKKGIDTVIKALSRLIPDFPNLQYYVVGDGEEKENLQMLATNLGISGHVHLIGRKDQSALCRYYQAADVYVQISRDAPLKNGYVDVETMGRTYFEAGGCGVPVIAARVGGVPSVVENGKNGFLVDNPENIVKVSEKISELIEDSDLRSKLGKNGILLAEERFSWDIVGKTFEDILSRCSLTQT